MVAFLFQWEENLTLPNHHGYTQRWNSSHPMGGPEEQWQQVGERGEKNRAKESLD